MKIYKIAILLCAAFSITACDTKDQSANDNVVGDNNVTETVLDDVDTIEGTISDAMINVEGLDESTDTPEEVDTEKSDTPKSVDDADSE